MAKYQLTKRAVKDLQQIWNYTYENWSEKQADKYYRELVKHCQQIADKPTIGRSYDFLLDGLRGSKVNKHIIFYRQMKDEEIEVARILHERMDIGSRMSDK